MGLITHPHTSHNQSNWGITYLKSFNFVANHLLDYADYSSEIASFYALFVSMENIV